MNRSHAKHPGNRVNLVTAILLFWLLHVNVLFAQSRRDPIRSTGTKPNIVFIMADDLGYTDLGCYGSSYYETPNIDRLSKNGVRFLNHHHCQNCAPTRAALMTGQYGPRTGVYTVGGIDRFDWSKRPMRPVDNITELPLDRSIIANQLRKAGYATGMFGKWHLGLRGKHHPSKRGFDEAIESSGQHFQFETDPKEDIPADKYLADYLTDKATDFIRRHRDEPFFLYLPHFGVHSPHQAKPELVDRFRKKAGTEGHKNPTYAAMIYSVDESVGRVLGTLEECGLEDKTMVIFVSDNGGVGGYAREGIQKAGGITDNSPLRSGKGSLYEGGTRVPMIIYWPNNTQPGSQCNVPTIHVDWYPTLLELSGAPTPEHTLDGESLVPLMRDPAATLHRQSIFQHFPGYLGAGADQWRTTPVSTIQTGDWKLMEFLEDGRLELYNLRDDIGEQHNLATKQPDKLSELQFQLQLWRSDIQAPMPTPNTGSKLNKEKSNPNRIRRKEGR